MTQDECQMTDDKCPTAGIKDAFAIRHVSFAMPFSVRLSVPVQ
ncbi:MAG: hypothetical protein WBX00_10665 [Isosphaeraceae bacterium]